MSFVTTAGQSFSDEDIRGYFATNPAFLEVARQAAVLGITADQIAGALTVGYGFAVTPAAVRDWIGANASEAFGWTPDGQLAALSHFHFSARMSGNLDIAAAPGMQVLHLQAGAGKAAVTGLHNGATVETFAAGTGKLTLNLADSTGSGDELNLKLEPAASADFKTIDAPGVETLNIESSTTSLTPASVTNTLTLSTTAHTTLNISGNAALDLSPDWAVALMSVKTVDASAFNAGLHVYLYGNTHDLAIDSGSGADIVVAGFGKDTISTGAGDDIIFAGREADTVDSGAGDDWIRGGPAIDVMTGGAGVDTFAYVFVYESSVETGIDTITDFAAGVGGDILDFHDLTLGAGSFVGNAASYAAAQAALLQGAVRAVMDTSTGTLYLDVDASGSLDPAADIAIRLTGVGSGLGNANIDF